MVKEEKLKLKGLVRVVYKKMGKAIRDYEMLKEGDRVLLGISGGMDSLALFILFVLRKERIPIKFDFLTCLIRTNFLKIDERLINLIKEMNVPFIEKEFFLSPEEINCFWCSWQRRKILFETARELNCQKVALGHNLDDTVETTLLNLFFYGEISTMKPKLELFNGEISIIRPLCYLDKKIIKEFVKKVLPEINYFDCPFEENSRRQKIKEIIKILEKECFFVKKNIFRALKRIRKDYLV